MRVLPVATDREAYRLKEWDREASDFREQRKPFLLYQ